MKASDALAAITIASMTLYFGGHVVAAALLRGWPWMQ